MPDYELRFLDGAGRVIRRIDLDCRDDGHAVELVGAYAEGEAMQLWLEERLVMAFWPGGPEP